mmetsp:Transcript_35218/g.39980  ORF Transcript_35218/g.39980 Transcript_35218/m.39980 type:complete len:88 (+) Transcript_35218:1411-1674(+)
MVQMTIFPMSANFLSALQILNAVIVSSPEVGSSKKMTSGSVTNSTATETLFRSPPDKPFLLASPTKVSEHLINPSSAIISSTLSCFS